MAADNNNNNGGGRLFLRSVRIDGYKCFSGFELPFGDMTLLLGGNGCGKTTVFDAINALHLYARGAAYVGMLFPSSSLPRWGGGNEQSFELRAIDEDGGSEFCYRLVVEHHPERNKAWTKREALTLNEKPLCEFLGGMVHLYRNDHTPMGHLPMDMPFSLLASMGNDEERHHLIKFRDWLRGFTLLSLAPEKMGRGTDAEAQYPNADGSNFASWYRRVAHENRAGIDAANESLSRVLSGYCRLELVEAGGESHRELRAVFASDSNVERSYAFDELSAGQRVLVALYHFLHGDGRNRLLLIDEPDNFVTLPEVQPLFSELEMDAGGELPQVAMISHHPEAMDFFSTQDMVWMTREPEQPARIDKDFKNNTRLHTSQLCAQGGTP